MMYTQETHMSYQQDPELRKKNIRTALIVGGFALFVFITAFPFWTGMAKIVGTQATGG